MSLVVAESILVDADGPAMTAVVLAAIADALEMFNEVWVIERGYHVAARWWKMAVSRQ